MSAQLFKHITQHSGTCGFVLVRATLGGAIPTGVVLPDGELGRKGLRKGGCP